MLYSQLIIGLWLTWGAMILAIISTSTMLPDLIVGGTIDLYLSWPMSRLRLISDEILLRTSFRFPGKSQSSRWERAHCAMADGEWISSLLLSVPLVLLVFSYVFAVAVFIGVWTRSAIAAILLSILAWGLFSITQTAEQSLSVWQSATHTALVRAQTTIHDSQADLDNYAKHPLDDLIGVRAAWRGPASRMRPPSCRNWSMTRTCQALLHRISSVLWLIVPKTRETRRCWTGICSPTKRRPAASNNAKNAMRRTADPGAEDMDNAAIEAVEEQARQVGPADHRLIARGRSGDDGDRGIDFCRRDY